MMFYIQDATCISSQPTFRQGELSEYRYPEGNKLTVIEPSYDEIPEKILRRMGKAVRLGVGAAMPLIKRYGNPDGIIIGTANGGMEDCIKFLNQIIDYKEGMLTPTNFVQSTANAVAGQVGMLLKNNGYNITHVHRGHSFENAMLDAAMHLANNRGGNLLLGAVDEISAYNYNIDLLAGWFKTDRIADADIYDINTTGSYPGEGAAMFTVDNVRRKDSVKVEALTMITSDDADIVAGKFNHFLIANDLKTSSPCLYMSGENGDNRLEPFYQKCRSLLNADQPTVRFKHMSGEFATASAIAVWLAREILLTQSVPEHMWRNMAPQPLTVKNGVKKILIYNNHKGIQHSVILCSIV
jgi:beta-ketoacyl synthase-like protein